MDQAQTELFALVTLQWDQPQAVPGLDDPVTVTVSRTWRSSFTVDGSATRLQIVDSIIPTALQQLGVPILSRPTAAVLALVLEPNTISSSPLARGGLVVPGRGGIG